MTIQNIQDVMNRIMSLNRNLTEQSLTTLLSASGWDDEDIAEGMRIFRNNNVAGVQNISPIVNTFVSQGDSMRQERVAESNSLGANQNPERKSESLEELKNPNPFENVAEVNSETKNTVSSSNENQLFQENKENTIENKTESKTLANLEIQNNTSQGEKSHSLIVIILIIILLLASFAGLYFYIESINEVSKVSSSQATQNAKAVKAPEISKPILSSNEDNITRPVSASSTISSNQGSTNIGEADSIQQKISDTQKQILALSAEVEKLKKSSSSGAKYITVKGNAGRGISSVTATTTGFIIKYTDNTRALVPFSTTTILNIINAQALCLNNSSSTQNNLNTNCLDQDSLQMIVNKIR